MGKQYLAIVTERGKLYASGFIFYRCMIGCRRNRQNDEDFPYELTMPDENWRVVKVFGCEKYNNIWVTAVNMAG